MNFNQYNRIFFFCLILFMIWMTIFEHRFPYSILHPYQPSSSITDTIDDPVQSDVLLIYVYARIHSHALENLKYFIHNAVRENDGVDYYFILQNVNNKTVNESELPRLPQSNAHYIQHENLCFDFGTVGWFLHKYTVGNPWINQTTTIADQEKKINITQYKYFILMNSSVRGPYFPPYYLKFVSDYQDDFEKSFRWYYVFTRRLNATIKLTGCTISCSPRPHVQSYVLVTDLIGLTIMLKPGANGGSRPEGIFGCYTVKIDVSIHSEVASSTRILDEGYMIDCLLTKYQTVDFKEQHNQGCNQNKLPYFDLKFEGRSLEPYEVVFVKFTDQENTKVPKARAKLYERWIEDANKPSKSVC